MADVHILKELIESIKTELGGKIDNLTKTLEEKDKKIIDLENKVTLLEEKLAYRDTKYDLLERRLDDSEQYSRRTSLRINGIPGAAKESADDCLKKVKSEVAKLGVDINDCEFDRAHRVGYTKDREGNPVKDRQMIVKFATFRARTVVYRNRNVVQGKDAGKVRFYIDQTKRRFELRKMAVDHVKDKPDVEFVFADVNCNLSVRYTNGHYGLFNSMDELINLVGA